MKRTLLFLVFLILTVSIFVVFTGVKKAAIMDAVSDSGMRLLSDTSEVTDFQAKLYDLAYSLPVGSEKVGLWLEALLSKKFETFSTQSELLLPELAEKLEGWPINHTIEIDLSGSDTSAEAMLLLGDLNEAEWIDLSRTKVDAVALKEILQRAPKLEKLQVNETEIQWTTALVDSILAHPNLIEVEMAGALIEPAEQTRLREGLAQ